MALERLRFGPTTASVIGLSAVFNALLYHLPLLLFARRNLDLSSVTAAVTLATLVLAVISQTVLIVTALALLSQRLLKPLLVLMAVGNSIAVYFVRTYHVVLDQTMMGNVLNTDLGEAFEYLHPKLWVYVLLLGALPAWLVIRIRIRRTPRARLALVLLSCFAVTLVWGLLASRSWPWLDKNSKAVGGLILPASYAINTGRYLAPRLLASQSPLPLPPATFAASASGRTVVVLVIGEAARAENFQLYGYSRPTNPLLSGQADVVALKNTTACATYTTAAVRCMLSNLETDTPFSRQYEPLPSYLQRNGVDVLWRTRNWGEPPLKVHSYQKAADLNADCANAKCNYDEVLLTDLEQRIYAASNARVFVVLHQAGSHGPAYYTKYPPAFEHFMPVCRSVELGQCSREELFNAYDNTILYQDHFLSRLIAVLKQLPDTAALMIYMSDHGESLGEYGTYLHGLPYAMAPAVQKDIPFILWMSDEFIRDKGVQLERLEAQRKHSQRDLFHTVMGAFSMHSEAYLPQYDVFSAAFSNQ
jgi:lipid A ethanolaminephosphotransferase